MGVVTEFLVPGVQDHHGSRLKLAGFTQQFVDRSPSTAEKQVVEFPAIPQHQGGPRVGKREHQLKVVDTLL